MVTFRRSNRWMIVSLLASFQTVVAHTQTAPPRARIVEDWRIKAEDHDLSRVPWVAAGPRNTTIVPLADENRLALFDSVGRRLGSVGGQGSGPGEFLSAVGVVTGWKADTMWVYESMQRRISYFSLEAKLLRTVAYTRSDRIQLPNGQKSGQTSGESPVAVYADGSVSAIWHQVAMNRHQEDYGGEEFLITTAARANPRTILRLPFPRDERILMSVGGSFSAVPFTTQPQVAVSSTGDRIAFLEPRNLSREGGSYAVSLFKPNGDTLFVRAFSFRGVPISKSDRDSAIAAIAIEMKEPSRQQVKRFQEIAAEKMPLIYPGALYVLLGQDDTVWIGHRPSSLGQTWTVLDDSGRPIGSVNIPPRARLHRASRKQLWTTLKDENDLPNVIHYRVIGLAN